MKKGFGELEKEPNMYLSHKPTAGPTGGEFKKESGAAPLPVPDDQGFRAGVSAQRPTRSRRSTSGTVSSPAPLSWWEACLNLSIFNFASLALESLYQAHRTAQLSDVWAFLSAAHLLTGSCISLQRILTASTAQLALLPHSWLPPTVPVVICAAHIALILLAPAFTRKHRRAIRTAFLLGLAAVSKVNRINLLWMCYVTHAATNTLLPRIHALFAENVAPVGMVLLGLSNPVSPLADILLVTAFLAVSLRENGPVCELPLVRTSSGIASLSPTAYAVARGVSAGVCGAARAGLGMPCTGLPPTCDAVLGFWQVAGWWLTCHAMLAAELAGRRAFLRTEQALAHVGPSYRAAALTWPFGRVRKVLEMGLVSALITACAAGTIAALSTPL